MAKDPYRTQRIVWFATMNGIALVIAGVLFIGVMYGELLDKLMRPLVAGMFEFKLLVVLIAMSPLLASLLVGFAYAKRALRRKQRERSENDVGVSAVPERT